MARNKGSDKIGEMNFFEHYKQIKFEIRVPRSGTPLGIVGLKPKYGPFRNTDWLNWPVINPFTILVFFM